MPQDRWPIVTTSVSGIPDEVWHAFRRAAEIRGISHQDAIGQAVRSLEAEARSGRAIVWKPAKTAPSQPIKMHTDVRDLIWSLADCHDFKQNVVVMTAITNWLARG
jgi:hypothetical protein